MQTFVGFRAAGSGARPAFRAQTAQTVCKRQLVIQASTVAEPASFEVKTFSGSSSGTASMALRVADPETAKGLVHRYLVMVRRNARRGTASTLTRSEVSGGGRKPFKQKGTGNARRGSNRTPLRPGGGIVFGPKPRDWSISMNKKEKRLALATALQSAASDTIVVEDFASDYEVVKTKTLLQKLSTVGADVETHKTLLILNEPSESVFLSGRNVERLAINSASAVQIYDVLASDKIVIEASALEYLNEFYGGGSKDASDA